jgi:arginase family enzyme
MQKKDYLHFLEKTPSDSKVSILGIPLDIGKKNSGTELAPELIRKNGLSKMLEALDVEF